MNGHVRGNSSAQIVRRGDLRMPPRARPDRLSTLSAMINDGAFHPGSAFRAPRASRLEEQPRQEPDEDHPAPDADQQGDTHALPGMSKVCPQVHSQYSSEPGTLTGRIRRNILSPHSVHRTLFLRKTDHAMTMTMTTMTGMDIVTGFPFPDGGVTG